MTNSGPIKLTAALGTYEHIMPLKDGSVTIPGVEIEWDDSLTNYVEIFRKQIQELTWDISVMSTFSYLCAIEYGIPITGLPCILTGGFHHGDFTINKDSGIKEPKDLIGKKVLTRAYTVTPGSQDKGILVDEFGVDIDQITWVCNEPEHCVEARSHLPPNVVPSSTVQDLFHEMVSGEIPAGIAGHNLKRHESDMIVPLFPNAIELDKKQYEKDGIIQPFQFICVKTEVLDKNPGLLEALYKGLKEAKAKANPKAKGELAKVIGEGADPVPYGRDATRKGWDEAIRQAERQHTITKKMTTDEIFPDLN